MLNAELFQHAVLPRTCRKAVKLDTCAAMLIIPMVDDCLVLSLPPCPPHHLHAASFGQYVVMTFVDLFLKLRFISYFSLLCISCLVFFLIKKLIFCSENGFGESFFIEAKV